MQKGYEEVSHRTPLRGIVHRLDPAHADPEEDCMYSRLKWILKKAFSFSLSVFSPPVSFGEEGERRGGKEDNLSFSLDVQVNREN